MINPPDYAYRFETPVSSLQLSTTDIKCRDEDNDGFYFWGIGSKPGHCPPCPDERDGDDNDPSVGPLNENGYSSLLLPVTESFDIGIDNWFQIDNDDLDWIRISGSTPSSLTGPTSADDGSYYIYVESSSPNYPNKVASIISPHISLEEVCSPQLQFRYHMYGGAMGSLKVYVSTDLGDTWSDALWTRTGNQGNSWYSATVDLVAYAGNQICVKFEGTTGSSYLSDIAIDKVEINSNSPDNTTYITTNTKWADYRTICDNVVVQNGATLTISGSVFLSTEATITVNNSSTLKIDEGILRNGKVLVNSGGIFAIDNEGVLYLNDQDDVIVQSGGVLNIQESSILLRNRSF